MTTSANLPHDEAHTDTHGLANIAPDDLANMYQGCIDDVNHFDPWQ
jgi:hypothetical protein